MNPDLFAAATDACEQHPQNGTPDRISRTVRDLAGQIVQVREGVGTGAEAATVTTAYTRNGRVRFLVDGNGNRSEMRYDGHDRLVRQVFPSATPPAGYVDTTPATALQTAGTVNELDYELSTLDPAGNVTTRRLRDGRRSASATTT
jgi:hypothetical protein